MKLFGSLIRRKDWTRGNQSNVWGKRGTCMGKKKMKKVIPFAVMTTMLLSATLPAFAASGFVFEDWDLGIVSERKEKLDDTDDAIKRRK